MASKVQATKLKLLLLQAKGGAQRFGENVAQRAAGVGTGTPRWQQWIAAILLPFIMVAGAALSLAVLQIVIEFVPAGFAGTDFVRFTVGTALFIGVFAFAFGWVKTGGFELFA